MLATYLCNSQKTAQTGNRPTGEKSPDLVTLLEIAPEELNSFATSLPTSPLTTAASLRGQGKQGDQMSL
jgi:hypothetical protein